MLSLENNVSRPNEDLELLRAGIIAAEDALCVALEHTAGYRQDDVVAKFVTLYAALARVQARIQAAETALTDYSGVVEQLLTELPGIIDERRYDMLEDFAEAARARRQQHRVALAVSGGRESETG